MTEPLAYDRIASVRLVDEDGRLYVAKTHISKATVNPYYGREIPNATALGLDADTIYQLMRDPEELAAGAHTFNGIPVLREHVHVTAENPRGDIVVGSTGTEASFTEPYLDNSMSIWDGEAIELIRSGTQRELSCAYRYTPVMEPGTYQGVAYDGRMTKIRGNHVALVENGRAGPDVLVADSQPEKTDMAKANQRTPSADAIHAALKAGKLGMDSSLEDIRALLASDAMKDCAEDEDEDGKDKSAEDEEDDEKDRKASDAESDDDKKDDAEDEDEEEEKDRKASDAAIRRVLKAERKRNTVAMDSAIKAAVQAERTRNKLAQDAREAVRPLVGDVIGMDSAADIYRYALGEAGYDATSVHASALPTMVQMAINGRRPSAPVRVAADSASDSPLFGIKPPRKL